MYLRLQKIGRDAQTGRFISIRDARKRLATTIVETHKIPTNKRPAVARRVRRRPNRPY